MSEENQTPEQLEAPPVAAAASCSPFKFEVGKTYELQNGDRVQIVARHERTRGYETVIDEHGCHRYDRSISHEDAGRVTGTPHDYSHLLNIRRGNATRKP